MTDYEYCKESPLFLSKHCYDNTQEGLRVMLGSTPALEIFYAVLKNIKHGVIEMPRQSGMSTALAIYALWKCIYTPFHRVTFVCPTHREVQNTNKRLIELFSCLQLKALDKTISLRSLREIQFSNGSTINMVTCLRGHTTNCVIFDTNYTFFSQGKTLAEVIPALGKDSQLIIAHTYEKDKRTPWDFTKLVGSWFLPDNFEHYNILSEYKVSE